jgi:hypothetical protein
MVIKTLWLKPMFSQYFTVNTQRLHYRDQPVNIKGNNRYCDNHTKRPNKNLWMSKQIVSCALYFQTSKHCVITTNTNIYRMIQGERSVVWEMIVSVIVRRTFHVNMCLVLHSYWDTAYWLWRAVLFTFLITVHNVFVFVHSNSSSSVTTHS